MKPSNEPKKLPIYVRCLFSIPLAYIFTPIFKTLFSLSIIQNKELFSNIFKQYTNYKYELILEKLPEPSYKTENCLLYFYITLCVVLVLIVFLNSLEKGQIIKHADVKSIILFYIIIFIFIFIFIFFFFL